MSRRRQIYEGKAKILFEGPEPGTVVQYFKDDATAFNAKKKGVITGKGVLNNRISEYLMTRLEEIGVPTHFVRRLNMREQLVREVEIIPIEVVIRNVAAGSFAERFGVKEGQQLPRSIVEYYYKNDALGDPQITPEQAVGLGYVKADFDFPALNKTALKINTVMQKFFLKADLVLVDFKLEFGMNLSGQIVLADEISPDSCRLWDVKSGEKMDKDRFRHDLGRVQESYQEVLKRISQIEGDL